MSSEEARQSAEVRSVGWWWSVLLALGLLAAYATTATWGNGQNGDAVAGALPAWSLVAQGTIALDEPPTDTPWFVATPHGYISNRPPGIWLAAVPAYALTAPDGAVPVYWPATLTAVLAAGIAMGLLHRLLLGLVNPPLATAGVLVMGLGTSTWSISANQLWPHALVQFWLVVGMVAYARNHHLSSGLALGVAVLTRPVTALIPLIQGLIASVHRRSPRPALLVGAGTSVGLLGLILYNRLVFGSLGISGGYPSAFSERLFVPDFAEWSRNLFVTFVGRRHGVLLWSPVLLVLLPGIPLAWRKSPGWVRGAAISGLGYLLIHAMLNRASGGLAFGYRYPLASITLLTPLLVITYQRWAQGVRIRRILVAMAAAMSIAIQLLLLLTLECVPVSLSTHQCSLFS